jgi:16S rRNA (guanine527-N7)-methyltransferase
VSGISLVTGYFPELEKEQIRKLTEFSRLLQEWNQKINLVSRADIGELFLKHILHSLAIARITGFLPGARILDAGAGGGFPGIPLAILFPEARFTMADSIRKKIAAVNDMIGKLPLQNATAVWSRVEDMEGNYDFVVSRAVGSMARLYELTSAKVRRGDRHSLPNGIICLKGGDLSAELNELGKPAQIFDIKDHFRESFFSTKKIVFIPCR